MNTKFVIASITAVAANIDMESSVDEGSSISYPCLVCGQWWRDGFWDDHALRKVASPA